MDSVLMIYSIEYYDEYPEDWRLEEDSFYVRESDCAAEAERLDDAYFASEMKTYADNMAYYQKRMEEYLNPCKACGKPYAKPASREPQLPRRKQMYRVKKIILK